MELKFKSHPYTTIEQSKKLLELGVSEDTSDIILSNENIYDIEYYGLSYNDMEKDYYKSYISCGYDEDIFTAINETFKMLIEKGVFNKDYLK